MSRPQKKLLIVEDEPDMQDLLLRAFADSAQYEFVPEVAGNPDEFIKQGLDQACFDAVIIDLKLSTSREDDGFRIALLNAFQSPETLLVVYSAFGDTNSVSTAFRHGTHEFLVKGDKSPPEVRQRVEELLQEREQSQAIAAAADSYFAQNRKRLEHEYPGQFLVVMSDEVVVAENSVVKTLLTYAGKRTSKIADGWPEIPHVLCVFQPEVVS